MKMSNLRSIKSLQSLRPSSFIVPEDIISVIVDQNFTMNAIEMVLDHYGSSTSKKMICLENNNSNINNINNNNNMMKILPVFATCRFSTLKRISSCLEDVVSHKNTRYQKVCAY